MGPCSEFLYIGYCRITAHGFDFGYGSLQQSGALTWTQNSRALILRTPTTRTPQFRETAIYSPGESFEQWPAQLAAPVAWALRDRRPAGDAAQGPQLQL